jgi:hypothetical protein
MAGWVLSPPAGYGQVVLGIDDGTNPVFPAPVSGAFNVEVFSTSSFSRTASSGFIVQLLSGTVISPPNSDPGFQASIWDPFGSPFVLENDFLRGNLLLGGGDYVLADYGAGGSIVRLGSGNQTVIGARGDRLLGGLVGGTSQVISALAGGQTVVGGIGNESIWGGANDSIVAGIGADQQIVVTGPGTTIAAGMAGNATISAVGSDTITALRGGTQNLVIGAGENDLINMAGNSGLVGIIGAAGDTITGGGGITNIEGAAGSMLIHVGAGGTTNLSGSTGATGNTVTGGAGGFNFTPGSVVGKGDLINLSGGNGTATINAFSFQSTRIASPDTILASNNADTVFGGDGDRIGTGNDSVVGGTHQWTAADTVAGASVGFGSNDTVSSTTYSNGIASRGTVAGTSSAQVTVTGFNTATDYLFYQDENPATTDAIIATTQSTTVNGLASAVILLPDGTQMTLVGVAALSAAMFKP